MFNSDFSSGKKERHILYDFCNNNHSTFLEHFKTTSLTVKSISGRGEEKESLKYQVIQISKSSIHFLVLAFSCQRAVAEESETRETLHFPGSQRLAFQPLHSGRGAYLPRVDFSRVQRQTWGPGEAGLKYGFRSQICNCLVSKLC